MKIALVVLMMVNALALLAFGARYVHPPNVGVAFDRHTGAVTRVIPDGVALGLK